MTTYTSNFLVTLNGDQSVNFPLSLPLTNVTELMVGVFTNLQTAGVVGICSLSLTISGNPLDVYVGPCDSSALGMPLAIFKFPVHNPLLIKQGSNATLTVNFMRDDAGAVANYIGDVGLRLIATSSGI